jgi:hypothetical protein
MRPMPYPARLATRGGNLMRPMPHPVRRPLGATHDRDTESTHIHAESGHPGTGPPTTRAVNLARRGALWRPPYPPWGVGPWPVRHPATPIRWPALVATFRRRHHRRAMTVQSLPSSARK